MTPSFELFDHTADIGVRVRAGTLAGLVAPSTRGLYAVIGELVHVGQPADREHNLTAEEPALLLRDFLADVLYTFDREHRGLTDIEVPEFTPVRLQVRAQVRAVDMQASHLEREVKAVTYHELSIREIDGGYEATYIVDI